MRWPISTIANPCCGFSCFILVSRPHGRAPATAACVSELTGKATVRRAFQCGWSMVGPGCVPLPAASQDSTCPILKKPKVQPDKVANILVPVVSGSAVPKPTTARAVEHHGQRMIHLWVLGSYSLCSLWKCGSPADPTSFAHFAREGELECKNAKEGVLKCKKCYDSNIADTFLQQACRKNRPSESESSSLAPMGPDFNLGVCPSSSSSTSCDSEKTRQIDKTYGSHLQSGLASGPGKLSPCRLIGVRGEHTDEGFMGARRSTGTGSARWFLFPAHTWEPLLLTWVV